MKKYLYFVQTRKLSTESELIKAADLVQQDQ